jgi:hemerythrin superfamily protein
MPVKSATRKASSAAKGAAAKPAAARAQNGRSRSLVPVSGVDVLTLLHQDHETVGALIDEVQKCEPGDRRLAELAKTIAKALTVHAKIEEDYFYPELRDRSDEGEQLTDVFEAYTEHDVIKHLVALVKSDRTRDEKFKAELQVLGEQVKHHVKEEESTIFKLARKCMGRAELDELGTKMSREKKRLTKSA